MFVRKIGAMVSTLAELIWNERAGTAAFKQPQHEVLVSASLENEVAKVALQRILDGTATASNPPELCACSTSEFTAMSPDLKEGRGGSHFIKRPLRKIRTRKFRQPNH